MLFYKYIIPAMSFRIVSAWTYYSFPYNYKTTITNPSTSNKKISIDNDCDEMFIFKN